ncbi:uncharacterized protein LOC144130022 [Amblyomma americanum]
MKPEVSAKTTSLESQTAGKRRSSSLKGSAFFSSSHHPSIGTTESPPENPQESFVGQAAVEGSAKLAAAVSASSDAAADAPTEHSTYARRKSSDGDAMSSRKTRTAHLQDTSVPGPQEAQQQEPKEQLQRGGALKTAMGTALVLGAALFPVLVLTWIYLAGTFHPPRRAAVCDSEDCRLHALALEARRNRSLDPCDDFGRFVCSAWEHRHASLTSSLTEQMVLDSVLALSRPNARVYAGDAPLHQRPEQFMGLCDRTIPTNDAPAIRALKEFLSRDLSFLIPREEEERPGVPGLHAKLLKALVILWG